MTSLRRQNAEAVADTWNLNALPKYRLSAAIVAQNLLDHPLLHEEASLWGEGAFVAVKRSAAELYQGPDPEVAHLSLFSPSQSLLSSAVEVLRHEGYEAVVVGQDSGHFLPGAPTDVPWMVSFLRENGFMPGGLAYDLERTLGDLAPLPIDTRYACRSVGHDDLPALDEFFRREFPERWRYDVMDKVEKEGPGVVFGLFLEEACEGFALLQEDGCRKPIGGAVWQTDLGPRWASLGPIGISSRIRGTGLGRTFLNLALVELQSHGACRTIIDWTGLVDFYGTQGFSVNRVYRSYRLSLREDPPPAT